MTHLTNDQLIALLATITNATVTAIQLLNLCSSVQLLLLDEYRKSQTAPQTMVVERNKNLRRYNRQRGRYIN